MFYWYEWKISKCDDFITVLNQILNMPLRGWLYAEKSIIQVIFNDHNIKLNFDDMVSGHAIQWLSPAGVIDFIPLSSKYLAIP